MRHGVGQKSFLYHEVYNYLGNPLEFWKAANRACNQLCFGLKSFGWLIQGLQEGTRNIRWITILKFQIRIRDL